jgi:hypothetical protein
VHTGPQIDPPGALPGKNHPTIVFTKNISDMVTIIDFSKRKNQKGEEFNALVLVSGIELVKSHTTGRYYATAKKTSIASTFDEATCRSLIGTEIPGSIQRVESEPFEFTLQSTGEVLTLNHRWVYLKEGETIEEKVVADTQVVMPV